MGYLDQANPTVLDYLMKKKKAEEEYKVQTDNVGSANFFADIGDVIAGNKVGSSDEYFNNVRKQKKANTVGKVDDEFKAEKENYAYDRQLKTDKISDEQSANENDVNSNESKAYQALLVKMGMKPEIAGKMNAAQAKKASPVLEKMYEIDERAKASRQTAQAAAQTRADALGVKKVEKDDKKKQAMNEIEDRRQNINSAIDALDKQIEDYGTYEMVGPQNQNMERLLDQVATDMAKLMDPSSVARPNEVELVKQGLVQSGFKNSNATARKILKEFKGEVERRADSAYTIRGMESPKGQPNIKVINGKNYKKVQGGWEEI